MKKALISLMVLAMIFMFTACSQDPESEAGTAINSLEGLEAAIKAGGKCYLEEDIAITEPLNIEKPITLDGNGKTVTIAYSSTANTKTGFVIKSSGVTIKNMKFESSSTSNGKEDSAMITVSVNGTADKPIVVEDCSFDSKKALSSTNLEESAIISDYDGGDYLTVKDCTIRNVKYGMYFKHISNSTISNNNIDGTLYAGIAIVADKAEEKYKCKNVTISNTNLDNIAFAKSSNPMESYAIAVGANSSEVNTTGYRIWKIYSNNPGVYRAPTT